MSQSPRQIIAQAAQCLNGGQADQAETLLRGIQSAADADPDYWRLGAMVARRLNRPQEALDRIQRCLQLQPDNSDGLNTLGLVHQQLGQTGQARAAFEAAIARSPAHASARINLARLHLSAGDPQDVFDVVAPIQANATAVFLKGQTFQALHRYDEAIEVYDRLCASTRPDIRALYSRALCHLEIGALDKALPVLETLSAQGLAEAQYALFTALARLKRLDEAERVIRQVLAQSSENLSALHGAAQLFWMQGRASEVVPVFEQALNKSPASSQVYSLYVQVLVQMAEYQLARDVLSRAEKVFGLQSWIAAARLNVEIEVGDLRALADLLEAGVGDLEQSPTLQANIARAMLMLDRAADAKPIIERQRGANPNDRFWVALQHTAARALGDDAVCGDLVDYAQMVRTQTLKPPEKYGGIEAFNTQLAETLRELHAFSVAPLDQSLRAGSQTSTDLRHSQIPIIRDFFAMVEAAVQDYIRGLTERPGHPLLGAIPSTFELNGAWSVKLGPDGRHVSHVHPEGWVSSVYYVAVPPQVAQSPTREGWLKFGEPPFAAPGVDAQAFVEPKPGELTLFPSYLWHGTVPITQGERLTVAFDISPPR